MLAKATGSPAVWPPIYRKYILFATSLSATHKTHCCNASLSLLAHAANVSG